ncbi:MAG: hypothetical protein ACE5HN_04120 [Nitrospiria bacterium]
MKEKRHLMRSALILFTVFFLYPAPAFSQGADSNREARSLIDTNLLFLEEKKDAVEWGRDPFVHPAEQKRGAEKAGERRFSLNAIIYKNGKGAAIINNRITRKGDQIDGMAVHDIQPDRVILKKDLEVLELKVDPFRQK